MRLEKKALSHFKNRGGSCSLKSSEPITKIGGAFMKKAILGKKLGMTQLFTEDGVMIEASNEVNIYKWPLDTSTNGDEKLTFEKAVKRMKDSYMSRISAMDNYLSKF